MNSKSVLLVWVTLLVLFLLPSCLYRCKFRFAKPKLPADVTCVLVLDGKLFVIRINWECAYAVSTARSVRIVVSIVDFDYTPSSIDPGSNPGRTSFFYLVDLRAFFYNQNVMMLQNSASTWKLRP